MIKNVKITNWRSHIDSNIDFSGGVNVLTGIIGAGKSSIMDAISFALFGTFPALQSKKMKLDEIIMSKPNIKDEARVKLTFSYNGKDYTVIRQIERGRGTTYSEIREGDTLIESPNSQRVTETIQKLLKIDYELFSKAIYSEQNALDYFLRLSKGERMKKIDNLLRIDKFEQVRSSAVTLKNKINDMKRGKQSLIEQIDMVALEKDISNLNKSLNESIEEVSLIKEEYNKNRETIASLEKKIKELEERERKIITLDQQLKSMQTNVEENIRDIKEMKLLLKDKKLKEIEEDLEKTKKQIEEKEHELEKKLEENKKLFSLLSEYKTKIDYLKKEKEKLNQIMEEKKKKKMEIEKIQNKYGSDPKQVLKIKKEEFEKINSEILSLEHTLEDLKQIVSRIENLGNRCPVCDSEITSTKREHLIHSRKESMKLIKDDLDKKTSNKKKLLEEINDYESVVEKLEKLEASAEDIEKNTIEIETIEKNIEELNGKEREINKNLESTKEELKKLQAELKELALEKNQKEILYLRASELNEKENRLEKLNEKMKEIKKDLEEERKNFNEDNFKFLKDQYRKTIGKDSELFTRIEEREKLIKEMKKRLEELKDQYAMIKKEKNEILRLEKISKNLEIFALALERTQIQLREEFIQAVNHQMSEIWPDIYPYSDYTNIRLSIEEGDYSLQLSDKSGMWFDVERLSGGERNIACLVLRIALSLVLVPHLNWLILDEPTHNLDAKSIEDLSETLRNRIGDFVEQIFLITHEKNLENAATGELYRIHRDKDLDGVSKIERVTEI